mgnify:CR=1 FL=1
MKGGSKVGTPSSSLLVFYRGDMYVLYEVEYEYRGTETVARKVDNQAAGIVLSAVLDVPFPVCFRTRKTWRDVLKVAGSCSGDMKDLAAALYREDIIMYPCMAAHRYLEGRMDFEEFYELYTSRGRRLTLLASAFGLTELEYSGPFTGACVRQASSVTVSVNGRRLRLHLLCPEYFLAEACDSGERVAYNIRQVRGIEILPSGSLYVNGLGYVDVDPASSAARSCWCLLAI